MKNYFVLPLLFIASFVYGQQKVIELYPGKASRVGKLELAGTVTRHFWQRKVFLTLLLPR